MQSIDLEEAMYFLMSAERHIVEDGARRSFPDLLHTDEVRWVRDGRLVAFSKDEGNLNIRIDDRAQLFTGEDSVRLRKVGIISKVSRKENDLPVFTFDLVQKI